jgi:hypothetical protein
MNKLFLIFYVLLVTLSFKSLGQQTEFKLFKGDGFEISYPQNWEAIKDGKVYNFGNYI